MRMATAPGVAWSFPPPICTSWRVESLQTTGPYRTRERNPWASASSRPPASPGTVRLCLCEIKIFEGLHSNKCSPSTLLCGRRVLFGPLGVFHMLLFWTLVLHGSICISFVTANFSHVWMWDKHVNLTSPSLSGLADADENCKRFMDRCMPEAFKKVSDRDPEI